MAGLMREDLDYFDRVYNRHQEGQDSDVPDDMESSEDPNIHTHLGSRQPISTIDNLQKSYPNDIAFLNFRSRLVKFFKDYLPVHELPHGRIEINDNSVTSYLD